MRKRCHVETDHIGATRADTLDRDQSAEADGAPAGEGLSVTFGRAGETTIPVP